MIVDVQIYLIAFNLVLLFMFFWNFVFKINSLRFIFSIELIIKFFNLFQFWRATRFNITVWIRRVIVCIFIELLRVSLTFLFFPLYCIHLTHWPIVILRLIIDLVKLWNRIISYMKWMIAILLTRRNTYILKLWLFY